MKQIVQFNKSLEVSARTKAAGVKERLYDVELDGDLLILLKFDKQAFDLAVGLEGLKSGIDYSFVGGEGESGPFGLMCCTYTQHTFIRPSVTLELTLQLFGRRSHRSHHNFLLVVDRDFRSLSSENHDEFLLSLNPNSLELARIIQSSELCDDPARIISNIIRLSIRVEKWSFPHFYYLAITGEQHQGNMIRIYPTDMSLNINNSRD